MVLFFYGLLSILVIINDISDRKLEKYLWIVGISLVWFLSVFVNENYVDWVAYQQIFEKSTTLYYTKDIGFGVLCYLLNRLGFEPISLRIVIFSVGFFLLNKALNKAKVNKLLFLLFYSYYPVPSDAIHLRTAIVSYISIYAIISYISDGKWLKYVFLILFATLFHKMAVLYVPIVFINKIEHDNKIIKFFLLVVGILIIIIGSNQFIISFLSNILLNVSKSINLGNKNNFIGSGIENGWIIDWGLQLLFLAMLFMIRRHFKKKYLNRYDGVINKVFWINVIMLIFLPFYLISFDYFRLFRSILAVNYIAICLYIQDFYSHGVRAISIKKVGAFFISLFLVVLIGYMKVGYRGRATEEFYNYYYNNTISSMQYDGNIDV